MSKYQADWNAAKAKFERDTNMKKPSDSIKVGIGKLSVSFKKYTGIENALKKVDDLMPASWTTGAGASETKALKSAINTLTKEVASYIAVLTKAADSEKATLGKTTVYRDIKALRASLDAIASLASNEYDKVVAANEQLNKLSDGMEKKINGTVHSISVLKTSLVAQIKNSYAIAQDILKNPTADAFNNAFPTAARDVTQPLNNIAKWTMPDDINPHSANMRAMGMQDPAVVKAAAKLDQKVTAVKALVLPHISETGNSAATASLSKMANNPIKLASNASQADVIAATKHFISQLKLARDIAAGMA